MTQQWWLALIMVCLTASVSVDDVTGLSLHIARGSIEDLVIPEGYPLEHHVVVTADGISLSVYRIPHGRVDNDTSTKPALLLQHGLLDSAAAFLMNGAKGSLGFILADAGYDVWLGNSRGNTFSSFELQSNVDVDRFWDFSLDELVTYDLPATVQYILDKTGLERISVIGHSQGTSIYHMWFATHHPLVQRIDMALMLAPIAFVKHNTSPLLRALSNFAVFDTFRAMGTRRLLPNSKSAHLLMGPLCKRAGYGCADMVRFLYGSHPSNLRPDGFDRYFTYVPAGSSEKLMIQWVQHFRIDNDTRLQKFDYGTRCWNWRRFRKQQCNLSVYGRRDPPVYDIAGIRVPMVFFHGGHDALADLRDVENLKKVLAPGVVIEEHFYEEYTHLDFIWGIDAPERVYVPLLKRLELVYGKRSEASIPRVVV